MHAFYDKLQSSANKQYYRTITVDEVSAAITCQKKNKSAGLNGIYLYINYILSACFMVVKSGTRLLLICTKLMSPGITVSEKFLMRVGERVQSRFYITAITCLHLY